MTYCIPFYSLATDITWINILLIHMSLPAIKINKTQNHRGDIYRMRKRNHIEMGINLLVCRDSNPSLVGSKTQTLST